jgi:hypothetical protein
MDFSDIERALVDYFEATGCDVVEKDGLEWFLSLYDEGPAISHQLSLRPKQEKS